MSELDAVAEAVTAIRARPDDDLAAMLRRASPRTVRRIIDALPDGLVLSIAAMGFSGVPFAPEPGATNGATNGAAPELRADGAPAKPAGEDKQREFPFQPAPAAKQDGAKQDGAPAAKQDGAPAAKRGAKQGAKQDGAPAATPAREDGGEESADGWSPGFVPYTGPAIEPTAGREWFDEDEAKVWRAVRNSHGVSVGDIAKLSGVKLETVKLRVKRLCGYETADVFQAGDRRFTRYAHTFKEAKEAAERAAKSAKGKRVGA